MHPSPTNVEIQHDLARCTLMRLEEEIDQQRIVQVFVAQCQAEDAQCIAAYGPRTATLAMRDLAPIG